MGEPSEVGGEHEPYAPWDNLSERMDWGEVAEKRTQLIWRLEAEVARLTKERDVAIDCLLSIRPMRAKSLTRESILNWIAAEAETPPAPPCP